MRKNILILSVILSLVLFNTILPKTSAETLPASTSTTANDDQLRGVWVSTVYNLDFPKTKTTDEASLMAEIDNIISNTKAMNLNAIFFQVRPTADSFYPSEYFPWSKYLTGTVGKAPSNNFDPLEYFIEQAHAEGIELHAWINPYRITKEGQAEFDALPSSHPAKQNPEFVVENDGNFYFNPAIPQVRKLILDSTLEIVENYDIDGIHFDDYFYPDEIFEDSAEFALYGAAYDSVEDFRRDNVNALIALLNHKLHKADPDISFGISPFGIWANKSSEPEGSNTNGGESYNQHYADTLKWVEEGMVDYIAPQLYWNIGHSSADYVELSNWWSDAVEGTDVELYIGMAPYRSYEAEPDSVWYGTDEIERQLARNSTMPEIDGEIFFRYELIINTEGMAEAISNTTPKARNSVPTEAPNSISEGNSDFILKSSSQNWIIITIVAVILLLALMFLLLPKKRK